jgi:hypothetical protein
MRVYLLTLVSAFLSSQASRTTIGMPRTEVPEVEKILKLAGRGTDIAWEKCGRPGTWGNIAPLEGRRSQQARWRRRRGRIITARRCHACTRHRGWARGYHDLCFAHRVSHGVSAIL